MNEVKIDHASGLRVLERGHDRWLLQVLLDRQSSEVLEVPPEVDFACLGQSQRERVAAGDLAEPLLRVLNAHGRKLVLGVSDSELATLVSAPRVRLAIVSVLLALFQVRVRRVSGDRKHVLDSTCDVVYLSPAKVDLRVLVELQLVPSPLAFAEP